MKVPREVQGNESITRTSLRRACPYLSDSKKRVFAACEQTSFFYLKNTKLLMKLQEEDFIVKLIFYNVFSFNVFLLLCLPPPPKAREHTGSAPITEVGVSVGVTVLVPQYILNQ